MAIISIKCSDSEKEAISAIANKHKMTISEYSRLKVTEPRVPRKVKNREMVYTMMKISELLYYKNPMYSDCYKLESIKKEVDKLWEEL